MKHALIVVTALAVISAGCGQQSASGPVSESPTAGKPATATLSEQKMCSEQANKSFRESDLYSDKTAIGNSYTNHYDVAAKICFIETSSRHFAKNNFQYGHVIYDAFEGRVYGSFYSASSKPEVVVECYVVPVGQSKIQCHSSDEFDALALQYFGTTQD